MNSCTPKKTARYLTLNVNSTLLVFNIETSGKLIDVPETMNTTHNLNNQ